MASGRRSIEQPLGRLAWPRWLAAVVFIVVISLAALVRAAPGQALYDDDMLRLAEIMGALHYLRPLCGADEAQLWREKMNALLSAEEPTMERRRRLVDRFNRSYRSLADVHRDCSPTATEIVERYLAEGSKLSRDIVSRYSRQ